MDDIWVEVSKDALINNYKSIKNFLDPKVKLCCVLKANAYSHDLIQTAQLLEKEKPDYFGLTHLDEALDLRHNNINTPILLFMPVQETRIKEAITHNIDLTCASLFDAKNINKVAENINKDANIHVKIETGMGRLGVLQSEINELFEYIKECPRLIITGTYTHFTHSGDSNVKYTYNQFNQFQRITDLLKKRQYDLGIIHCANSGATMRFPNMHLDMVRCGTSIFGQFPSVYTKNHNVQLQNTWTLKSRIVAIRHLPVGSTVGYGSEWTTSRNTKTAVIACGFSHGYTLKPESLIYRIEILRYLVKKYFRKQFVSINGTNYPIIGRISMQMSVVDITDAKEEIKVNDEAIIPTMRLPVDSSIPRIFV